MFKMNKFTCAFTQVKKMPHKTTSARLTLRETCHFHAATIEELLYRGVPLESSGLRFSSIRWFKLYTSHP